MMHISVLEIHRGLSSQSSTSINLLEHESLLTDRWMKTDLESKKKKIASPHSR